MPGSIPGVPPNGNHTMTSAATFRKLGVSFYREDGVLCFEAKNDLQHGRVLEEIALRAELMYAKMPKLGFIPLIRITDRPEQRWGACMCCGDEMLPNEGGMCPLCIGGLKLAHRKREQQWSISAMDVIRSTALCRKQFSTRAIWHVMRERELPLPPDESAMRRILKDASDVCRLSEEHLDDLELWDSLVFTEEGDPMDVVSVNDVSRP